MIYVILLKLIFLRLFVYVFKILIFYFYDNFVREKIIEDDIKIVD